MNIILLGPQGSGKGTQAKLLVEKVGLYYFEMGEFLRRLAKTNPLVDEIMNEKGELVPDDIFFFAMKALLSEKISAGKGILLDGFPRTIRQYGMLKDWFDEEDIKIDKAILIDVSEKESIRRLSARRICEKCGELYNLITNPPPAGKCKCGGDLRQRKDDQPEQIKERLRQYNENTKPLLNVFEKEGILEKVDGERPIAEIHKEIYEKILLKNQRRG